MDKEIYSQMKKNQKYQNGSEVQTENDEINSPKNEQKEQEQKQTVKDGDQMTDYVVDMIPINQTQ